MYHDSKATIIKGYRQLLRGQVVRDTECCVIMEIIDFRPTPKPVSIDIA